MCVCVYVCMYVCIYIYIYIYIYTYIGIQWTAGCCCKTGQTCSWRGWASTTPRRAPLSRLPPSLLRYFFFLHFRHGCAATQLDTVLCFLPPPDFSLPFSAPLRQRLCATNTPNQHTHPLCSRPLTLYTLTRYEPLTPGRTCNNERRPWVPHTFSHSRHSHSPRTCRRLRRGRPSEA